MRECIEVRIELHDSHGKQNQLCEVDCSVSSAHQTRRKCGKSSQAIAIDLQAQVTVHLDHYVDPSGFKDA
jgi:hypothetical protein